MGATNGMGKGKQSPHKTRGGKQRIKGMTLAQLTAAMESVSSKKEKHRLARLVDYIIRVNGAET